MNLIVKELLSAFQTRNDVNIVDRVDDQGVSIGTQANNQTMQTLRPLSKIRVLVRKVRASPQRIQAFKRMAFAQGDKEVFVSSYFQLVPIIDVVTRWNSTDAMLLRALAMIATYRAYAAQEFRDLLELSEVEWEQLRKLSRILHRFKEATLISSGQNYITASDSIAIYEGYSAHNLIA
jgi:hypothetical protein